MIVHRVWALVSEELVKNTIVCDSYPVADNLAKMAFGDEAMAVEITQIRTQIGHKYVDGLFLDEDNEIIPVTPTVDQEIQRLLLENNSFKDSQLEQDTLIMELILGGD